jgi:hypothetical protein
MPTNLQNIRMDTIGRRGIASDYLPTLFGITAQKCCLLASNRADSSK